MALVYWAKPANAPLQLAYRVDQRQGLIGFKLQVLVNSSSRTRDLGDICDLLRTQRGHLNTQEVREYICNVDRVEMLDEFLAQIADEAS